MITIQTDVEEREEKGKFNFKTIARKFKFSRKTESSTDKKSSKKNFKLKDFFSRRKKEPEVQFDSGYGEFVAKMTFSSFLNFFRLANRNFIDSTTSHLCPERKKMENY